MAVIEFDLTRTVHASIQDVFERLADINGHNDWMPKSGSMLRRTRQTSPGAPAIGTTFLDETSFGPTPGEIAEFQPPHMIVYHWWDKSKAGKLKLEGWPAYRLEEVDGDSTLVHHHAKLHTYGMNRFATPLIRRIAMKERSVTLEALAASFEPAALRRTESRPRRNSGVRDSLGKLVKTVAVSGTGRSRARRVCAERQRWTGAERADPQCSVRDRSLDPQPLGCPQ